MYAYGGLDVCMCMCVFGVCMCLVCVCVFGVCMLGAGIAFDVCILMCMFDVCMCLVCVWVFGVCMPMGVGRVYVYVCVWRGFGVGWTCHEVVREYKAYHFSALHFFRLRIF